VTEPGRGLLAAWTSPAALTVAGYIASRLPETNGAKSQVPSSFVAVWDAAKTASVADGGGLDLHAFV
jgi:hypothetical protein